MVCGMLVDLTSQRDGSSEEGARPRRSRRGPDRSARMTGAGTAKDETPMTTAEQAQTHVGPRILLVEDEPRIRDFITRALVTAGYHVAAARCGAEGLRMAQASDYDLVILDLIMPDVDGRTVLAQVLKERREQAVLVLSCLADVTTKV